MATVFTDADREHCESSHKVRAAYVERLVGLREDKEDRESNGCGPCLLCSLVISMLNNEIKMTEQIIENLDAGLADRN